MSSEQEVQTLTTQIHSFFERDKEVDYTWLPTVNRFTMTLGNIHTSLFMLVCCKPTQERRREIISILARCYVQLDSWAQSLLNKTYDYMCTDIDVYDEGYILRSYENASSIDCLYFITYCVSSAACLDHYKYSAQRKDYKTYTWPHQSILNDIRKAQILIVLTAAKIDLQ